MAYGYVPPEINVEEEGVPLLVGRDPGEDEVKQGRPFVGEAGTQAFGGYDPVAERYIDGAFQASGLRRDEVNIANRVGERPPNNDFYAHGWEDIHEGWEELCELIDTLNPNIIVAMGNEAAFDLVKDWQTLTDRNPGDNSGGSSIKSAKKVTDRRGFFFEPADDVPSDAPVLVTLHPATCLYQAVPNQMLLEIDFMRMGAYLRGELPRHEFPEPTRIRGTSDLEPLFDSEIVAFDIETTKHWREGTHVGRGNRFLCIAFADDDLNTYVAYEDTLGLCEEFLASDVPKVAHNFQFDKYILQEKMGLEVNGKIEDTQGAHWACYPELAGKEDTGREDQSDSSEWTRKGLNFLASFHKNYPWWKSYVSATDEEGRRKMAQLCANDVYATRDLWDVMVDDMEYFDVRSQYEDAIKKTEIAIITQSRGIPIDEELRQERLETLEEREETLLKQAQDTAEEVLKSQGLTHKENGDEFWWFHAAQCTCCNGGKKKSQACPSCAGIEPSGASGFLVADYKDYARESTDLSEAEIEDRKKEELRQLLPVCKECGGEGKVPTWDFNPVSSTQLPYLLWEVLDVPAYCHNYNEPNAQEETIREVLEWAKD